MNKLSIIIPAYNEEATIEKIINVVEEVDLSSLKTVKEIIVVDDCSKDNTFKIVRKLQKKFKNIRLIRHKTNKGKGFAIRSGLNLATGDITLIQDADLEYSPEDYPELIKPILEGKARVVYGSRRLNKENKVGSGIVYYIGGMSLTWIANLMYNTHITDEATCYKVFRTDLLKSMNLKCKRFEFCPEVTAKTAKRGIRIKEIPISYYPRSVEEGKKIKWQDWFEAVWALLRYRISG